MMYNKKVLKHFLHPKNMGKMKNPDGVGRAGNIVCGDVMEIYIKVKKIKNKKEREIIKNIKFQTFGCAAAIATSSMLTEIVNGKTIKEALKIKNKDIIKKLGNLPAPKIHCSILAIDALRESIYNFLLKNKRKIPEELKENHKKVLKTLKLLKK